MATTLHDDPRTVAAFERQMQTWTRLQESEDRAVRRRDQPQLSSAAVRYVTISRETGTGGQEIARQIGQRLGWEVLDKNLLDRVAEQFHEPRMMLELVNETPLNWVYDVLGTWMDHRLINHQRYVAQVGRVVLAAARRGNLVIVGRGAQFLLPRDKLLAVRLVAPLRFRVEQVAARLGIDEAKATRIVEEGDRGRREFVERFFHHDVGDPHVYDLVINVQSLGAVGAADQILAAMGRK